MRWGLDLNGRCDEALQKAQRCNPVLINNAQLNAMKYSKSPKARHWLVCIFLLQRIFTKSWGLKDEGTGGVQ
jgi:hypothetical protein